MNIRTLASFFHILGTYIFYVIRLMIIYVDLNGQMRVVTSLFLEKEFF